MAQAKREIRIEGEEVHRAPASSPTQLEQISHTLRRHAYSQHTTSLSEIPSEWITVTHPHHPLYGLRVQLIRVRRGPDPDLIIRMPDGYHGAIAASLTDYAGTSEPASDAAEPPLLAIEGLWRIAQWVSQQQRLHPHPGGHEI